MIRGVCFDMDGLLFDTESLGADKMRDAVALQGYQLDSVPWEECLGQNDASINQEPVSSAQQLPMSHSKDSMAGQSYPPLI